MRKAFREKYGSKLFALAIIIMMITVVYPTLITNAKNPSQLSAYDDDWNDISTFASDIDEDQNGNHVMKTIVSRPAIINKISDIERNSTEKTIEVNSENFETNKKGIFAAGDICSYPGKLRLILSGFHEVALASVECFKRARPNEKYRFEFTTSSKTIQDRLGKND